MFGKRRQTIQKAFANKCDRHSQVESMRWIDKIAGQLVRSAWYLTF
ncbi:hypothetical protein CEV31_3474 [Brucella thiophenivorans]|uniref:Uncharacterized protein n=1 Tax=Brucella thiophenivorans TaxID=571255 RepID=A0A256FEX0_9HYPH|nr:hypothetical protein CEV31_3474 [Brucella thiophenivorans]